MRLAAAAAAALFATSALAAGARHHARGQSASTVVMAEATVMISFPRGTPFKPRPAELRLIDVKTGQFVASVRAREWTPKSATYELTVPAGQTYSLRWSQPGHLGSFAELAIAENASKVVYKIPYVPKPVVTALR